MKPKRQIGGNIPYTTSIGVFEKALRGAIDAETPVVFNRDFMSAVLNVSGGAAAQVTPILKKIGFLDSGSAPTSLYSQYQSESERPEAALTALRNGFPDIFQRNAYAHKLDEDKLKELIKAITGLPKGDPIIGYMYNTFAYFQKSARSVTDVSAKSPVETRPAESVSASVENTSSSNHQPTAPTIGISHNINIVLPSTTNIEIYNTIFRSLKANLLQ